MRESSRKRSLSQKLSILTEVLLHYIFPINLSFNMAKHSRIHRFGARPISVGAAMPYTFFTPCFLAMALALNR